jgi:hypothetical protein
VPSDCFTMAWHHVLGLTAERASHVPKFPRCNEAPSQSRGSRFPSTISCATISGEHSTTAMLMDHIPRCPCSWYVIQLHDRIVHVLEGFMFEAGATKGRDLRLEARCIRSGASRNRHGDVVWLDFMAPHRHLVVDLTITSARTNTHVLRMGARLPLTHSRAVLHWELSMANSMRTSALLLCLARLRFILPMATIPSLLRMGAGWRLWRLS